MEICHKNLFFVKKKKKKSLTKFFLTYLADFWLLKVLRQPTQKFWPKILTPYFFYSNLYLHFLRPCCENIFKFVCIVSEKIGKWISQFGILFLALTRSCLQFQWNLKYLSSAVLRIMWPTVDGSVARLPFVW